MIKTGKIAVVGDKDSVLAFKAIGADVFSPNNVFETNDLIRKLSKEDYAVIFITEQLCVSIPETIEKLKTRPYPAVIPIPSLNGTNGYAMTGLKKDVEKAIGADILFNKEQ